MQRAPVLPPVPVPVVAAVVVAQQAAVVAQQAAVAVLEAGEAVRLAAAPVALHPMPERPAPVMKQAQPPSPPRSVAARPVPRPSCRQQGGMAVAAGQPPIYQAMGEAAAVRRPTR